MTVDGGRRVGRPRSGTFSRSVSTGRAQDTPTVSRCPKLSTQRNLQALLEHGVEGVVDAVAQHHGHP